MTDDLVSKIKKLHEDNVVKWSYFFPEFKEDDITKRLVLEKVHPDKIFVEKKNSFGYEVERKINLTDIGDYPAYVKLLDDYFNPKESASPLPPASPQTNYQKYPSTS